MTNNSLLNGDELIDARFDAVEHLTTVYDVSYWSNYSDVAGWIVSGCHEDNDKWLVDLSLIDSTHILEMSVLFRTGTADIIDVFVPDNLLAGRFAEANEALMDYSFDRPGGGIYEAKEFSRHSPDEVRADLILGWADEVSHTITVEFKPRTAEIVHIDIRAVDEADGAFCD